MNDLETIAADNTNDPGTAAGGTKHNAPTLLRRYNRHIIFGLIIACAVVFLFGFMVAGSIQQKNAKQNNEEPIGADSPTIDDVATIDTPGLRSTSSPSPSPVAIVQSSLRPTQSTMLSEQSAFQGSATSGYVTTYPADPSTSTTLEPSPGEQSATNETSISNNPPAEPSASSTPEPFFVNVSSWLDAFNALTSNTDTEGDALSDATSQVQSTGQPTASPTGQQTKAPTAQPTDEPTKSPTDEPTKCLVFVLMRCSSHVTKAPTDQPTKSPTKAFSINVTSWINAFNALTLEQEMMTTPSTAAAVLTGNPCLTQEECDSQRQSMGFLYYVVDDHPMKGCFYKSDVAYFGLNGTAEEMSSPTLGQKIRIWCGESQVGDTSTTTSNLDIEISPTHKPTTPAPTSTAPTQKLTIATPAPTAPTVKPTNSPTMKPTENCFTVNTYESIDNDIARLKLNIVDSKSRSHFLGGIVRLAAHDFMDFDQNNQTHPMGPDGCFDPSHAANAGLPEEIWCPNCTLTMLYEEKYSHVSRGDFWVASANAVVRQTSINNTLDLRETFMWGRVDADTCPGSGERIPSPEGCGEVEHTFLIKMGLSWKDAVALMGAHTLGRGDEEFSGHHGTWVDTDEDAQNILGVTIGQIFDKQYYEEIYLNSWRPRDNGQTQQDWTTGRLSGPGNTRVMLNTDMCLVYDIDDIATSTCCSRTGWTYSNGQDRCIDSEAAKRRCPMYTQTHERWEAAEAVGEMLGGPYPNNNNVPFYNAYMEAWRKATTVGQANLSPLLENCESPI
ncbi:hypothetical protein ACHAXR_007067 [Thalassiosira sp. AJA248-18]